MKPICCSANRCSRITCQTCAWRRAGKVAARIEAYTTGALSVFKIDVTCTNPEDFRRWRTSIRNLIDHRRRSALDGPRWRCLGMYGWLQADGAVRGVVALGGLDRNDVEHTLVRRWPTGLTEMDPATLRVEVYWSLHPRTIWVAGPSQGRYQPVKIAICPVKAPAVVAPVRGESGLDPMPVLVS